MSPHRSVSVIIPTYNRAELLPQTLEAVLAQTSPAEQIIVVDDGSTDGTAEMVVTRYGHRVTLVRIENSGDLAARNRALAHATGELVAFCDSDDLWQHDFLAEMRGLWQAEPRLVAGFANFRILRGDCLEPGDKFAAAPPGFWSGLRDLGGDRQAFDQPITDRLIAFQPFFPSCLMVRRETMVALGGWDESVSRLVGSDFATILRLGEHAPLGIIRRPLVGIRKHASNHSGDVQAMNLGDAAILERLLTQRPALRAIQAEVRASIGRRRRQALDTAFARGDLAAVAAIYSLLPEAERGLGTRVKARVAALPRPLGTAIGAVLLNLGSRRAAMRLSGAG